MIGDLLQTSDGRRRLSKRFNLCNVTSLDDYNNRVDWAGYGVITVPAQLNDDACTTPACSIRRVCQIMTVSAQRNNSSSLGVQIECNQR